ncbi:MAG TPA: FecR family protein [Gemmatimonadota bacterium]|nr:FecR family protein [Gemmatimonadota bacterium]
MRKLTIIATLAFAAAAFPLQADDARHQSYISYDDGGTLLRPADDEREIEARVNLPLFPGDEVITNRRGRTEIRLADGNVVALDRATAIRFRSILDSYEGEAGQTVAELRYGKVAVYRIADTRDSFRLDTPGATYFASSEAIFSVETDSRARDRVSVFDGAIEVRTPLRSTRLRSGEQAEVDDRGMYDVASYGRHSADDFEAWFLRRAGRYGATTSRYLDRSLAYYDDELSRHGSWVNISQYGWAWRPSVAAGWRPYHHGYWMRSRLGCLTWVSYEPWGWVPYHYGRWSYDPYYGWFWVPGIGYAPAWVYWWYGNGYLGWAPAGWWDLHRPYYPWAYRPFHRAGLHFGFGFYGRIRVNDVDLRPWTFIDAGNIVSNRADRAALTTDAIRDRLARDRGGFATISSDPARFTREEFRDPAAAINRRWQGVDTGRAGAGPGAGPTVDLTPFIRRDPDLSGAVRDRVVRNRPADGAATPGRVIGGGGGGGLAPIGGGNVAPIGGGSVAPIGGGSLAPVGGERERPVSDAARDRINRGTTPRRDHVPGATRGNEPQVNEPDWRDRLSRPAVPAPAPAPRQEQPAVRPRETPAPARDAEWRGRVSRPSNPPEPRRSAAPAPRGASRGSSPPSEVPRRVIDRIGGARVQPGDRGSSRGRTSSPPPRSVDRPSSSSSGKSSPPPRSSGGGSRSSGGAARESGGKIKRDN